MATVVVLVVAVVAVAAAAVKAVAAVADVALHVQQLLPSLLDLLAQIKRRASFKPTTLFNQK